MCFCSHLIPKSLAVHILTLAYNVERPLTRSGTLPSINHLQDGLELFAATTGEVLETQTAVDVAGHQSEKLGK